MSLAWMGYLLAAALLASSDAVLERLPSLRPERAYPAFVAAELAFLLLAWPLWGAGGVAGTIRGAALLILLALPPAVVAAGIADEGWREFLAGQALAAASALFSGSLLLLWRRGAAWYFLAVFLLVIAHPLFLFVLGEHGHGGWEWTGALSPFRAALEPVASAVMAGALGTVSIGLLFLGARRERKGT